MELRWINEVSNKPDVIGQIAVDNRVIIDIHGGPDYPATEPPIVWYEIDEYTYTPNHPSDTAAAMFTPAEVDEIEEFIAERINDPETVIDNDEID